MSLPCNDCAAAKIYTKALWREFIDGVRGPKTYCDDCRRFIEKMNHIQPIAGVHTKPRFPIITFQPL